MSARKDEKESGPLHPVGGNINMTMLENMLSSQKPKNSTNI